MGDSQEDVRKDILGEEGEKKETQQVEQKGPPAGPPPTTVARMILTWRLAISLLLALAVLNTAVSVYVSSQSRWPTSAQDFFQKSRAAVEKAKSYAEGVAVRGRDVFQSSSQGQQRGLTLLERLVLALSICFFGARLLMEMQVVGDAMAGAEPPAWVGPKALPFELLITIGLGGLLAWLGALTKSDRQALLLYLLTAYLILHGLWMIINFGIFRGGTWANTGQFLGLGLNSLVFGGLLLSADLFCPHFQNQANTAAMASLTCLASSVIGVRITAESFFGGSRTNKVLRDLLFIIVSIGLIILLGLAILARR